MNAGVKPFSKLSPELSFWIVSDLHCHIRPQGKRTSPSASHMLTPPDLRDVTTNPVLSFLRSIPEDQMAAEMVLCPGDLAHRVCHQGFLFAWYSLKDIAEFTGARTLLCTVGNHDVDTHGVHDKGDPWKLAKNIHQQFPCKDQQNSEGYWRDGFYLAKEKQAEILVLNTVIDQKDEASAQRGTFGHERITRLETFLNTRKDKLDQEAIRIVMMHHQPVVHSDGVYGSGDSLPHGDELLALLMKYGFRFIIHGHRHSPRIGRIVQGGTESILMAAGSFSAKLEDLGTQTRNVAHRVTLKGGAELSGSIVTWEFNLGHGWKPTARQSSQFPHIINFQTRAVQSEVEASIIESYKSPSTTNVVDEDLRDKFPGLFTLLPEELDSLSKKLTPAGIKLRIGNDGVPMYLGVAIIKP